MYNKQADAFFRISDNLMTNWIKTVSKWPESQSGIYAVICISIFIKLVFIISRPNIAINVDGVLYISAAQQFALGNFSDGFALYPMPLYSLMIAAVHFFVPNWVAAARLLSFVSMVLCLIPLYLLTRNLFNRKAAFWAGLAFAVAPLPNKWIMDVIRDPVYILFLMWAVYFAHKSIESKKHLFFLMAFIFLWISVQFRIEGIFLFFSYPAFLLLLIISAFRERIIFIKWISIWIALPVLCGFIFVVTIGMGWNVTHYLLKSKLESIYHFQVFDNMHRIYVYFKTLDPSPPFIGQQFGGYNFADIVSHYIPVIYLLGFLEALTKSLFPIFIIPLFYKCRRGFKKNHFFVCAVVIFYLLIVYFDLLERDFTSKRFLAAPAFLLYPWVGAGLEKIFAWAGRSSKPNIFTVVFLAVFIISPFYDCARTLRREDSVIRTAGNWLKNQPEFEKTKIITTDYRVLFYAGRQTFSTNMIENMRYENNPLDCFDLELTALKQQMDIVIVRLSAKKKKLLPEFIYYKKTKEFRGRKNVVAIYCSDEFRNTLHDEIQPSQLTKE